MAWVEKMIGVPLDQTLTLEVDADPGDVVAERLFARDSAVGRN